MRMRKKKWARPELARCPYFVDDPRAQRGKWHGWFRGEDRPLYLELGCGKGVFLAELALRSPRINFLGVDLSRDVLGVARRNIEKAYAAQNRPVDNIALAAHNIEQILLMMDRNDAVERIYINFCNPWPKEKHHKRRLTHPRQLRSYQELLAPGGEIHFKTDDDDLYRATLRYFRECGFEILRQTEDLHAESWMDNIESEHELMFAAQGIPIKAAVAQWENANAVST